jgi:glycosyltransferase involved in cell wall biosynthesis
MQKKLPFFTVAIPTKNRSFLIQRAIDSALLQTFPDFEIVVIDNDDTSATQEAVLKNTSEKIRHVRTGGFTMPDNWERCFQEARGKYVLVLEDKSVLKPRALQTIFSALQARPSEAVSWPQDLFNDMYDPPRILRRQGDGALTSWDSKTILKKFMSEPRGVVETLLPRGLNSCISQNLIQKIRNRPGGRLCPPVSPDYTHSFVVLNSTDTVLNIDDCLTVYGSCRHSFGRECLMKESKDRLAKDFRLDLETLLAPVPLKLFVTTCGLYGDFVRLQEELGGRLAEVPLDLVQLWAESYRDILLAESYGVPMEKERGIWEATRKERGKKFETDVEIRLQGRMSDPLWRVWARNLGLGSLRRLATRPIPPAKDQSAEPHFVDPLQYVQWEAKQLTV